MRAAVEMIDCDAACASMRIEGSSGPALKTTQAGIIFLSPRSCPCPASLQVATKRGNAKWRMIITVHTFAPSNSLAKFRRVAAAQAVTFNFDDSLLPKVLKGNEGRNVLRDVASFANHAVKFASCWMLTILKSSCRGATFMNLRQIEGRHRTNRWAVRHSCRLSAAEISATYFRFWHKAVAKGPNNGSRTVHSISSSTRPVLIFASRRRRRSRAPAT
jgi:hypothetical protein